MVVISYEKVKNMKPISETTVGIVDFGLFSDYAVHIAKSVKKVYYHVPSWKNDFPSSRGTRIGSGLAKNMIVAKEFWDIKDECDWFWFPDVYLGDWQEELKRQGKKVCGSGKTEWLERNREKLLVWEAQEGMNTPKADGVVGLDKLEQALEPDDFIKIDDFRADMETTRYYSHETMKQWITVERAYYGPWQNEQEFLLIKKIDGKEIGYDGWELYGQYPQINLWGTEMKGNGYAGKISRYDNMPMAIKDVNAHLAKVFKQERTATMFSTEIRIDKKRRAFLIDPAMREGNPPNQSQQVIFNNMPDVFYHLANGELIEGKPAARYVVQLQMWSDFVKENPTTVSFPESIRPFVKLRNIAKLNNEYIVVPASAQYANPLLDMRNPTLGAVVGLGNTLKEALDQCRRYAEQITAHQLEIDFGTLDKLNSEISELKEYGIQF